MRPGTLPLAFLLLATMVGQGIAVGARLADDASTGGRPGRERPGTLPPGVPSDEARALLCGDRGPETPVTPPADGPGLPESLQPIADAITEIRGLDFLYPVQPEPLTRDQISERIEASVGETFPRGLLERRTKVWRAMGVIPPDADLAAEIPAFSAGSIIGYYDTISKELVYVGTEDPSPYQRVTVAHELTHALDDQHFNLSRLDVLDAECADDALIAGVAVAEGSARVAELLYISQHLTEQEFADYQRESLEGPGLPDVSPFLIDLLLFPYPNGQAFVQRTIQAGGGFSALDGAMNALPASTEQILHPDKFPGDEPTDVDAPDASVTLEGSWTEIDVYDVGEAFLRLALALRLSETRAVTAAAGWDGGEYRAWSNQAGDRVAILLDTVWDSKKDATEFLTAMRTYLGKTASGAKARALRAGGTRVVVMWATDGADLDAMGAVVRR